MKVILREYGDKCLVTKEVEFRADNNYYCDGRSIRETNILTLLENDGEQFVQCSNCGESIPNNPKSIREHLERKKSHKGCLSCRFLRIGDMANQKVKYVENEDGTFHRSLTDDVNLMCGSNYYNTNIMSENRAGNCRYRLCNESHIKTSNHFFAKYPNAFDEMITVDVLKFKEVYNGSSGNTRFSLKCRGIIEAIVNTNGIIDGFYIRTRGSGKMIYYSKKYNELFCDNSGKYEIFKPDWYWTQDRIDYIKKYIANLYN